MNRDERLALLESLLEERILALASLQLHPLTGDREGHYAMKLTRRMRLILTVEKATVTIKEVSAHYGD